MFSFFRRRPKFSDQAYLEVADMLTSEENKPTFRRDLLNRESLDYSLESLKQIDSYLEAIRKDTIVKDDMIRLALRSGAYVGEVIKRLSKIEYHWLEFEEAAKQSKLVKMNGMSLSTAVILWAPPETILFPVGKVCKYIEFGSEDSVYALANFVISEEFKE